MAMFTVYEKVLHRKHNARWYDPLLWDGSIGQWATAVGTIEEAIGIAYKASLQRPNTSYSIYMQAADEEIYANEIQYEELSGFIESVGLTKMLTCSHAAITYIPGIGPVCDTCGKEWRE